MILWSMARGARWTFDWRAGGGGGPGVGVQGCLPGAVTEGLSPESKVRAAAKATYTIPCRGYATKLSAL